MIFIKNGRIIDPESGFDGIGDVVLEGDKIRRILKGDERKENIPEGAKQVIDATGLVVAPGLVDVHVHFRDPGLTYKEDIHTGAAAAAKGWDTVVCPSPEDLGRIEHLLIPGLGLGFVTSRPGMDYGKKPYRRIRLDAMVEIEGRNRLRFQARMAALLREEAVAALKDAKANHDKLEGVYNPYVDFDGVRELAAIETGRLLSYLG